MENNVLDKDLIIHQSLYHVAEDPKKVLLPLDVCSYSPLELNELVDPLSVIVHLI